jgi:hypothetical protein
VKARSRQWRSSIFCGPRRDRCYVVRARHVLVYAVMSHNSGEEVVFSAVVRAEWLLRDNRRSVFYVIRATPSAGQRVNRHTF